MELNPHSAEKDTPDSGTASTPPSPQARTYTSRKGNALYFDPCKHLISILGTDITKIPGIEANLAVKLLSEVGADMSKWRSAKHFTSWLGLCPNNKVSGGKQLSSRTKPSANKAAMFFRMAANGLYRSETALGGFLRRTKAKLGAPKAITATARKIAVIFYSMMTQGKEYVESGLDYYEKRYKERLVKGLKKRAAQLGFALSPIIQPQQIEGT